MARNIRVCPRCGNKCLKSQERCNECDLVFSRLEFASNKTAKRQLIRGNRDFVIYTKELPSDVKRWKLVLYVFLLGLVGGHYFYVGKYGKGILMCLGFIYWISATILNPILANYMEANYLFLPISIYGIAWVVSLIFILSKKFKVPILIDENKMKGEILAKKEDFDRTKQQIIAERKELEAQKTKGNKKDAKDLKTEQDKEKENVLQQEKTDVKAKDSETKVKDLSAAANVTTKKVHKGASKGAPQNKKKGKR